jgi:hypothetical protein
MMHVSPCGWYCFSFNNDGYWKVKDTREKTTITCLDQSSSIELLCARKAADPLHEEISEFHEEYLTQEKILPSKTVLSENPFGVKFYVTKGTGMDERFWIVCHAFWNNYCVFMKYHGIQTVKSNVKTQIFYDILNSLQPLVNS